MPVSDDYFVYPRRGYGMDHERYAWSNLFERDPFSLPGNARVALWVTPLLQWFPLNSPAKPFVAPGGLSMPYPDFRHYTNRDYGNRVGIFRIVELLPSRRAERGRRGRAGRARARAAALGVGPGGPGLAVAGARAILSHARDTGAQRHRLLLRLGQ